MCANRNGLKGYGILLYQSVYSFVNRSLLPACLSAACLLDFDSYLPYMLNITEIYRIP